MAKRGIRVMLWIGIVLAVSIAGYFFWIDETRLQQQATAAHAFSESAAAAARAVLDVRAAQQAYVASGQGDDFWGTKVTSSLSAARQALAAMRSASTPDAQMSLQRASTTLEDFEQMDRRVREYVRSGQQLMASDVIFSDGLEMTESVWIDMHRARTAERQAADAAMRSLRERQRIALAGAAVGSCLLALLLVPAPRPKRDPTEAPAVVVSERPPSHEDLALRAALDDRPVAPAADFKQPAQPPLDVPAVARLCTELARVSDTRALPLILDRAAGVLDAAGIILWIADPDGRELSPILAHGYSPQLVSRLGTIPRDAENVTAAAFRTGLLQTVKADAVSNGAVAAPLMTHAGCVGVMAAEVRHGGERQETRLAATTIVAAQLATLVGPPVARGSNAEAAGG